MKILNSKGFGPLPLLLVLAIAGAIGFTTWYVLDQRKQKQSDNGQTTTQSATAAPITFEPESDFSEQEKSEILTKIAEPFRFYQLEMLKADLVSITVAKSKDGSGYKYSFGYKFASTSTDYGGLFGQNNKIGYWVPQLCDHGGCSDYPEEFREKYPENYQAYLRCEAVAGIKESPIAQECERL